MDDLHLPDDWGRPRKDDLAAATELALRALAAPDLASYYRLDYNYGGASFATLGVNDPYDVRADDLHATAMLSVSVGPLATRHMLEPGVHRESVLSALGTVRADVTLAQATADDLVAAFALHRATVEAISNPHVKGLSNPWVTASKINARKRPHLIPVRDNVVGKALGGAALKRASVYWLTMRGLLREPAVISALESARRRLVEEAARGGIEVVVDESDLRLLDAALWKQVVRGTAADDVGSQS